MSVDTIQRKVRAQLWDSGSSSWIDAPGDATNGLKVQGPLTDAQLRATRVPVDPSGVTSPVSAAALPLPTGAATDSNLNTQVGSAGSSPPALDTGASGVLGWLRKLYGAITGTLTVDGSGHTQPVSGTFWQATQPVSAASLPLPTGAAVDSSVTAVTTSLGTDGSSPPTLPSTSTGVRGWLRLLYNTLAGTLTTDPTDRSGRLLGHVTVDSAPTTAVTAAALPLPTGAATETTVAAVSATAGATSDAEASSGNGSLVALLKRLRTLLNGGLPAALSSNGGLKVEQVVAAPTQPVSGTVTANAGTGTFGTNPTGETTGVGVGAAADAEATTNGSAIAVLKRLRTLLNGGLPAALSSNGGLKVEQVVAGPAQPVTDNGGSITVDAAAGSFGATVTPMADSVATGNFTANGDTLVAAVASGMTMWGAYVQGTYATGATIFFEASVDGGTTYSTALMQRIDALAVSAITSVALTANLTRFYHAPIPPGATHVRMRVSAWASPSGTINARIAQRAMPVIPHVSVLQGAANPMQTQVGDGTSQATVIARGTAPASTDKGIGAVLIGAALPSYQVVTNEITLATTTGVKECLNLWHPSSLAKDVFIVEIGVNIGVQFTVGRMAYELSFTSVIGTGGTTRTPQPLGLGLAASSLEAREVKTGGGTLTGAIIQRATLSPSAAATPSDTNTEGVVLFRAKDLTNLSDAIQLRNAQAEGLNIQADILSALTGAPIITIYARYIERA